MLLNLKCVTRWVRIHVDMSGTPSATMIISGTLMHIMTPTHITKIFIVRTSRITNIHLSHCFSIRYNARGETFLVTRHVLFTHSVFRCSFMIITWSSVWPDDDEHRNTWEGPECISPSSGVAIPATTPYRTLGYYPVRARVQLYNYRVTDNVWRKPLRPYRTQCYMCLTVKRS